ncbi:ALF repeat-containing protein [Streptomyces sp. NPDC059171]|uniref:ALF repeat-containing protein n=1 Tax=Streptomyces sp. NPDC059171 TaxID=3346755 RepID=UPI0036BF9ACA
MPTASAEDIEFTLFKALSTAGKATRDGMGGALPVGDAVVGTFLKGGFRTAIREELKVVVTTVMAHGGRGVKREAGAALEADSDFALRAFLSGGRFTSHRGDRGGSR